MPNIKSAIKRMNSNARKAAFNKSKKSEVRSSIKAAMQAVDASADNAAEIARVMRKKVDQAAARGLISKNRASRKKSQIDRKLAHLA